MDRAKFLRTLHAILRISLILANHLTCLPTYIIWMILLRPLLYYRPQLYFYLEAWLYDSFQHLIAYFTWNIGYTVVEAGDDVSDVLDSECLVLVNHQSTGDVLVMLQLMTAANKRRLARNICWILADTFTYTHFGLVCSIHGDFFIRQGKETREAELRRLAEHLREVYVKCDRSWLVLFPEGGFLHKRRETSQAYGKKHGYPHLEHCTLPRVGAIQTAINVLSPDQTNLEPSLYHRTTPNGPGSAPSKNLKYIIDVTIAYDGGQPFDLLSDVVVGNCTPRVTTIHYRKYPMSSVPRDEDALLTWLYARYAEKDVMLEHFYRTGKFPAKKPPSSCDNNGSVHDSGNSAARHDSEAGVNPLQYDRARFFALEIFYLASTCLHAYALLQLRGLFLSFFAV